MTNPDTSLKNAFAFSDQIFESAGRRLFLAEMIDDGLYLDTLTEPEAEILKIVLAWMRNFIMQPHPNAITPKAVCSHVESAFKKALLYFSIVSLKDPNDYRAFYEVVMTYKNILFKMKPEDGPNAPLRSLVILFPGVNPEFLIPKDLKIELLNEGVMPGAFKPFTDEKAFMGYKFFPAQNPTSILVMRPVTEQDWPVFIRWDKDLQFSTELHPFFKKLYGNKAP